MSFTTLTKVGQGNGSNDLQYNFTGTSLQKTDIQVTVIESSTPWDSFSTYGTNAERSYNGNLYRATALINPGQNPPIHTTGTTNNWLFVRVLSVGKNLNTHYTIPTYNPTSGGVVEFIAGSDNGLTSRGFATGSNAGIFTVRIERVTSSNPIVEFAAGSSIKADDLNKQNKQALFVGEDTREAVNSLAVGDPQSAFQVSGSNIVPNSITTGKIDNGAIITEDLANGAVTDLKVSTTAAIDGTKISPNFGSQNIVTTGTLQTGNITADITIDKNNPAITFSDNNNDPDYQVGNINGVLRFQDTTNNATRFQVNTDGHVDFLSNVDFASGIDVTGTCTATTFSGSGASITDIAAANITSGGTLPSLNGNSLTNLNGAAIVGGVANRPAWFMTDPRGANNTTQFLVAKSVNTIINNYQNNESGTFAENGTNASNGDFTIPTGKAGMYFIFAGAILNMLDDTDAISVFFFKNGTQLGPVSYQLTSGNNIKGGATIFRLANLSVGDVIQAGVFHNHSADNLYLEGANTFFGGFRLSV